MSEKHTLRSWVDGEWEPKDRTLFVMERRPLRSGPSEEEGQRRERHRLNRFLVYYPIAAMMVGLILTLILLATVLHMPLFGAENNPANGEVAEYYLEHAEEETGAENVVTAMILDYRGFDTLGESCVLFLSVVCVTILLQRDEKNTSEEDLRRQRREEAVQERHHDVVLNRAAMILVPFIFLFAIYVLLHGEESPGGGFAGGAILGGGLILFSSAFGHQRIRMFMNRTTYSIIRTGGLLLYALLYGGYIFCGANGLPDYLAGMNLLIDFAVGLVVACTIYGFYVLFAKGEL